MYTLRVRARESRSDFSFFIRRRKAVRDICVCGLRGDTSVFYSLSAAAANKLYDETDKDNLPRKSEKKGYKSTHGNPLSYLRKRAAEKRISHARIGIAPVQRKTN